MAAPRGASSEGLIAVAEVDGARIGVFSGKIDCRSRAILGVCEAPPDRITYAVAMSAPATVRSVDAR